MLRSDQLGSTVSEMVRKAQVIWGTFKTTDPPKKDNKKAEGKKDDSPKDRPAQTAAQQAGRPGRPKLSPKEHQRRQDEGACFKCAIKGHQGRECKNRFNPDPPREQDHRPRQDNHRDKAKAQPLKRGKDRQATPDDSDDESQPAPKRAKNE
jgi:hypothetical protein